MKLQQHVSIRRILALVSLLFLLLPVGGLYFLRIYESALIRQTESELISQGAFVAAMYQHEIKNLLAERQVPPEGYGLALRHKISKAKLTPIFPRLDLARDPVHPARPQPFYTSDHLDPAAISAGRRVLPVLQEAQRTTLSGIKLLDYQGLVVTGETEKGLSFRHAEEFQDAIKGKPVSFLRARRMAENPAALGSVSRNANINVYVAMPIVLKDRVIGVVWLNRTPMDLNQALYGKRTELIWTVVILVLAATLIARLTSLTITRPIRALVQKTRMIAKGDAEGRVPLNNPITREVSELSDNIAKMATTIQHRTQYIQNFTAHVSHEFKTPLTAIRGSVELLQDNLDDMPKEQQRRFLSNIAQDTERLGRLVSRLLELTRADMTEGNVEQASDVRPVLEQIGQRYQAQTIQVRLQLPNAEGDFRVGIAPDSLEAVLAHLVENSQQAGASRVEISVRQKETVLFLDIKDNGPGVSEANRNEIFTPFFTTRRNTGGTGLGLSIAQSILERFKGRISLASSVDGAHFTIELPICT